MSGSHEKLPWLFWAQLFLAAVVLVLYLLAPTPEKHGETDGHVVSESSIQALKPVGEVAIASADGGSGGGSERTGKAIVEKTCQSCHAHGVANAPKLDDSGKASWESRLGNGIEGLIKTAKKGKGAMPVMGTDPTLSDAELKNAIVYMLEKAGVDVPAGSVDPAGDSADAGSAKETPASNVTATSEEPSAPTEQPSAPPEQPAEPSAPAAPAENVVAKAATPEPAKAPEPSVAPEPVTAPEQAEVAAPVAPEQPSDMAVAAAPTASTESLEQNVIDGKKLYQSTCFSCHATGVAGSPKVEDKAAWAPRIATGIDALYESAIKGKGVMPPKGGNMSFSDDQIKAAVDYMVSQSK